MNDTADQDRNNASAGVSRLHNTDAAFSLGEGLHRRYGVDPGVACTLSGFGLGETMLSFAQGRASLAGEIQSRWPGRERFASGATMQHSRLWSATTKPIAKSVAAGPLLSRAAPGIERSATPTSSQEVSGRSEALHFVLPSIEPEPSSKRPGYTAVSAPAFVAPEAQSIQQSNVAATHSRKVYTSYVEAAARHAEAASPLRAPVPPSPVQRAAIVDMPTPDNSSPQDFPAVPQAAPTVSTPHVDTPHRTTTGTPVSAPTPPFASAEDTEPAHFPVGPHQPRSPRVQSHHPMASSATQPEAQSMTAQILRDDRAHDLRGVEKTFAPMPTLAPASRTAEGVSTPSRSVPARSQNLVPLDTAAMQTFPGAATTEVGRTNASIQPEPPQPMLPASSLLMSPPPKQVQTPMRGDTPLASPVLPSAHITPTASRQADLQRPVLSRAARVAATLRRQQQPLAASRSADSTVPSATDRQHLRAQSASVSPSGNETAAEEPPVRVSVGDRQTSIAPPVLPSTTTLVQSQSLPSSRLSSLQTPAPATASLPSPGVAFAVADRAHPASSPVSAESAGEPPLMSVPDAPPRPEGRTAAHLHVSSPTATTPALISEKPSSVSAVPPRAFPLDAARRAGPQAGAGALRRAIPTGATLAQTPQKTPLLLRSETSATSALETGTGSSTVAPAGPTVYPEGDERRTHRQAPRQPATPEEQAGTAALQRSAADTPAQAIILPQSFLPRSFSPRSFLPQSVPSLAVPPRSYSTTVPDPVAKAKVPVESLHDYPDMQGFHAVLKPSVRGAVIEAAPAELLNLANTHRSTASASPSTVASFTGAAVPSAPAAASTTANPYTSKLRTAISPQPLESRYQPLMAKPTAPVIQSLESVAAPASIARVHRRLQASAQASAAFQHPAQASPFSGVSHGASSSSQVSTTALQRSPANSAQAQPLPPTASFTAGAPLEAGSSATGTAQARAVNLPQLADQIYALLVRRLANERQRKGA